LSAGMVWSLAQSHCNGIIENHLLGRKQSGLEIRSWAAKATEARVGYATSMSHQSLVYRDIDGSTALKCSRRSGEKIGSAPEREARRSSRLLRDMDRPFSKL